MLAIVEAVFLQAAGLEVLDQDLAVRRETAHELGAFGLGEVDGDRALVAVGGEIIGGVAVRRRRRRARKGGPQERVSSPAPGFSILITSAPKSPRICVAHGPASTRERSSTRTPARAALGRWCSIMCSRPHVLLDSWRW